MDKLKSFITALCFFLTTSVCMAQNEIISHGISTFGDLKYEKDFKYLSYVNPDAPKGGEISFWAFGSFDSMHPYTRKGRAGAYSSIFFESSRSSLFFAALYACRHKALYSAEFLCQNIE